MKTSELKGAALDWAVAKCEGRKDHMHFDEQGELYASDCEYFDYSTDWAQGGQIIERERIAISYHPNPFSPGWKPWQASMFSHRAQDESPLMAAMRCYVASKLGDEVEIPEELL